jgi:hypothetical protein
MEPKVDPRDAVDITAPNFGVDVTIREDGKVVWVSVDGITILRICQIPYLEITMPRSVTSSYGEMPNETLQEYQTEVEILEAENDM